MFSPKYIEQEVVFKRTEFLILAIQLRSQRAHPHVYGLAAVPNGVTLETAITKISINIHSLFLKDINSWQE